MAAASNPTPTPAPHSPPSAAAASFETSELVAAGAALGTGSPRHHTRRRVAGTQILRIGDIESIVSSSLTSSAAAGFVAAPVSDGAQEETTSSSSLYDRSPVRKASSSSLPEDGATEVQQESSESGSGGVNAAKRPAWNKLSNVANAEIASVMGAESWPALSESARASPKSFSSDTLKAYSDGSSPSSQGTGTSFHAIPNSTSNHAPYSRQRTVKHGWGNPNNSVITNGGFSPLSSPRSSGMDAAPNNSGKHGIFANDSSPGDNPHQDGGQRGGSGSQSHSGNDLQPQRSSFRRGNGGSHSRGNGSHHNGYGGRRSAQDRGNQDWNAKRSFSGRDTHIRPQRGPPRPLIHGPPPPPPPPFISPPPVPVHSFVMPVVYPGPHPDSFRPVSLGHPMVPMVYAFPDFQLHAKILSQIDYYFSDENLIKDTFLRQKMDDQGWVPIELIANFKKVMQLTDSIPLILDSIRSSSVVEVEGEKVRRRNDWMRWIISPSVQYSIVSSPQSSEDVLSANLQNTVLDDKTPRLGMAGTYLSPSSSGEWSSYSMQSSGEKMSQVSAQGGVETSAFDSR